MFLSLQKKKITKIKVHFYPQSPHCAGRDLAISGARIEFSFQIALQLNIKSLISKSTGISWLLLTKRPHTGPNLRWKWDTNRDNWRRDEANGCVS